MDVIRDVLDKSVVDRNGREMGRVDAIVIECSDGPPQITALLIGPAALGSRLHPALGRLASRLEKLLGIDRERPTRIDVDEIDDISRKIHLRLTISDTGVGAFEQLFRGWVSRMPGSQ